MSGRITDLVVGGMGTLGAGIGAGVEGYRTEKDWQDLQAANPGLGTAGAAPAGGGADPIVEQILAFAQQGMSPEEAVARLRALRQQGGARPINVPGQQQANVVQRAVPTSPMPGGPAPQAPAPEQSPLGSLGALRMPEYSAPPDAPTTAADVGAAAGADVLGGLQLPSPAPAPAALPPQRTPVPATMARPGVQGNITPRNFQLAQFIAQQQGAQQTAANAARNNEVDAVSRVVAARIGADAGQQRALLKAATDYDKAQMQEEARNGRLEGQLGARIREFDVRNGTNVFAILTKMQTDMARIQQSDINNQRSTDYLQTVMEVTGRNLDQMMALRALGDPYINTALDGSLETLKEAIRLTTGIQTEQVPGPETPRRPGILNTDIGATPPKPGPTQTRIVPPGGAPRPPAPAPASGGAKRTTTEQRTKKPRSLSDLD